MGTPRTCHRCGNKYAGAFDNELVCEWCNHDNGGDAVWPVIVKAFSALLLIGGIVWGVLWIID